MNAPTPTLDKPVNVLLVEDNSTDIILIKEALKRCRFAVQLVAIRDGEDAMAYLRHEGHYAHTSEPDLVLLDLNLPRKNGWDVLSEIKKDEELSRIPVLVVTSSWNEADTQRAYRLNAELYLVKPLDMSRFPLLLKSIEQLSMNQPWTEPEASM